ncbi:MAG: phospho-N-acetylmuramoyl-pentapeptide-transferase [Phycisphaerales bacterium]|nr:phospho-N-acetylmuramoyl-pentapeptide-transferase [Phycisphaerales bacterium]
MIPWLMELLRNWLIAREVYSFAQLFEQIHFRALSAALLSFVAVIVLGKPVIGWLRRKKIGDTGMTDSSLLAASATSKASTPTMGGLLIVGAIVVVTLLLADVRNFYIQLGLIVAVWLAVLGGFDDWLKLTAASRPGGSRQGLRSWEKLVFQLGLGLIIGYFAFNHGLREDAAPSAAHVLNLPFQKTYENAGGGAGFAPGLFFLSRGVYIVVAILMIAGMSNATNISDGMDGLATGISAAVALGVMVLCGIAGSQAAAQYLLVPYVVQSDELTVLAGAMAGACMGFLWFNCSPASVFMGDTGSLALGGLIAYLALVIRQEAIVLFMCMVFLLEIGSVVLQVGWFKMSKGKRIFKCAPYHHHLHLSGWREQQVVSRFWIVSVLLVVLALASIKAR